MKLAAHLGRTHEELLRSISSTELTYWYAKERIDPLPDWNWAVGMILCMIARTMGGSKNAKPSDFMRGKKPRRQQSEAEQNLIMQSLAAQFTAFQQNRKLPQ